MMENIDPFLENPTPDFDELVRVFKGEQEPKRVYLTELVIDAEILQALQERFLGQQWIPDTQETKEAYCMQMINLYNRLGYDALVEGVWRDVWVNHPPMPSSKAEDTAGELSRGEREWACEGRGLITSWETFEKFPWEKLTVDYTPYEILARRLPPGMKIYASSSFFEHVLENLLGYEGLFYLIHDEPDLVAEVFSKWGRIVYDYYKNVIDLECVGAIWHADDLGYKTNTMLSPEHLRRHVLPWFKKYAELAHDRGKIFLLHSCGNFYKNGVIDDLIHDTQIDAIHSFQDVILPIGECMARYGERIAILGGLDVDSMVRLNEESLRTYIRDVLETCMPGRFALGSGNTIANYIPLDNYLIMLDEARRWNVN